MYIFSTLCITTSEKQIQSNRYRMILVKHVIKFDSQDYDELTRKHI